jgi:diguanylate cyclase
VKHKGKIVASSIGFLIALFLFFYYSFDYKLDSGLGLFVALLFVIAVMWIGKQQDNIKDLTNKNERFRVGLIENNKALKQKENELFEKNSLLEQTETMISQFFNNVDVTAFSYDVFNKELDVAKGVEEIYGYTHKEFMGNNRLWYDAIHPDDKQKASQVRSNILAGKKGVFEHRIIRPDLEIRWVSIRYSTIVDPSDKLTKIIGVVIDITDRKRLEEQLKQLAYHDELTDLPNRTLLRKHLSKAIARSKRHEHDLTIMFIDLDGFKKVNDTMGHEAGDILLKEVACRLDNFVREEDLVARLGGDEFIVVFEETGKEEVESIADRIVEGLSNPYLIGEEIATISPSIGISIFPEDGEDVGTLLQNADKAMYAVKSNGKSGYRFYSPELQQMKPKETVIEKFVNLFTR